MNKAPSLIGKQTSLKPLGSSKSLLAQPEPEEPSLDPVEATEAVVEKLRSDFQKRADVDRQRMKLAVDSEYWVCFCFETREQREAFLKGIGLPEMAELKHVDGLVAADRLGVKLPDRVRWPGVNFNKSLAKLAVDK